MAEQKEDDMESKDSYAVGIDLGTTYSCIAVWIEGKVTIIPNEHGKLTTPSVVAFTDTDCLIGEAAVQQSSDFPLNTIFESKRIIGRKFNDQSIQDDIERYPFKVISSSTTPSSDDNTDSVDDRIGMMVVNQGQEIIYQPEQISAMILSQLKRDAEKHLNATVTNAIITVPAYFNDSQRTATKDAGTIAGFNVMRVINEPTAAAIAYGLDLQTIARSRRNTKTSQTLSISGIDFDDHEEDELRILVFDLGGGTFDVSLLTILDGFFEVKATAGDTHLGGMDFDTRVTDYIMTQLTQQLIDKYPNIVEEVYGNPSLMRDLRTRCEQLKCALATEESAEIKIDYTEEDVFEFTLTRHKFEDLCSDLFVLCLEPIERVLRDAVVSKDEIDDIVFVGGSTRIPKIRDIVTEFFNGKPPCTSIDPDQAVAYGAAMQAATLSTTDVNKRSKDGHLEDDDNDIFLLDVTPLSLGLETDNGKMTVLIPRNTRLPTQKTEVFSTLFDDQTEALIEVFEGERACTEDNNLLGRFNVTGIKEQERGTPQIAVTFGVDENGILTVSAVDKQSQNMGNLVITNNKGRLTQMEIEEMLLSAERNKEEDKLLRGKLKSFAGMERFLYALHKILEAKQALMESESSKEWVEKQESLQQNDEEQTTNILLTPKRPKRKFKLFSLKDTSDQLEPDQDVKENEENGSSSVSALENKMGSSLVVALGKISEEEYHLMVKSCNEFMEWLEQEGQHCVDNKKIDEKQRDLEMKIGDHVTSLITDTYNITRSCRSLSMSLMQF